MKPLRILTLLISALMLLAWQVGQSQAQDYSFSMAFSPSTAPPNSTVELQFAITNGSNTPITDIAFTLTLPANFEAVDLPKENICGDGGGRGDASSLTGTSTITFAAGQLGTGASCQFTALVQVPGSAMPGTYTFTTSTITSTAGAINAESADLTVNEDLLFSKLFSPSTAAPGDVINLQYTIENRTTNLVANLQFTDDLVSDITGMQVIGLPLNDVCPSSGTINVDVGTSTALSVTSGILNASSTCTFTVPVQVPLIGPGQYTSTSSSLTATVNFFFQTFPAAFASLTITDPGDILLEKVFITDTTTPGGTITAEYTVSNTNRDQTANNITFNDNLGSVLTGVTAAGLPQSDVCGAGSSATAADTFTLSGGTLAPEATCTFTIDYTIPSNASGGTFTSQTGVVNSSLGAGNTATDLFTITLLEIMQSFQTNPVVAGDTTTLQFTITNLDTVNAVNDIAFTQTLRDEIGGVFVSASSTADICGSGSSLFLFNSSDNTPPPNITFTDGSLAANSSCTFDVDVQIPQDANPGAVTVTTSSPTATVNATNVTFNPASDTLNIVGGLSLSKSFGSDATLPGGTVDLTFTITSESPVVGTNITFTDDLNATLVGLTAINLPLVDPCGVGSTLTGNAGNTFLMLTAGTLPAAGAESLSSCEFTVTVQVPQAATTGTYTNTTSDISGQFDIFTITGSSATADLLVADLTFRMEFVNDPVVAGETVDVAYTIINESSTRSATGIFFTHSLSSSLSGLTAVAPLPTEPCGAGSSMTGTTSLIFTGGNLDPSAMCTITVTLQVPTNADSNTYGSLTSNLSATIDGNVANIPAANAQLTVNNDLLAFSKSFENAAAIPGSTIDLMFRIENLDTTRTIDNITFTDDLSTAFSGLDVTSGLPTSACGGTLERTSAGQLSFAGGTLSGGGICTFTVTVDVPLDITTGEYTNTTSAMTGEFNALPVNGNAASATFTASSVSFSVSNSEGNTITSEQGESDTVLVVLTEPPAVNVTIAVSFTDTSEITLPQETLVFTPQNWNEDQLLTVTGIDDNRFDGDQYVRLQFVAMGYPFVNPEFLALTNLDDESDADPNRDGIISPSDANFVLNRVGEQPTGDNANADVNGDGVINTADLLPIGNRIEEEIDRPDANNDGYVTAADVLFVFNRLGNDPIGGDAPADVNHDGVIDLGDAAIVGNELGQQLPNG